MKRIAIYSCYIPYNEDSEKNNRKKLEDLRLKMGEQDSVEVIGIFEESLPAKTQLEDRPELLKLLEMAKNNMLNEIIIPRMGQLTTSYIVADDIFERFKNEKVCVKCLEDGICNRGKMHAGTLNYIRLLPKFEDENAYLKEITMG